MMLTPGVIPGRAFPLGISMHPAMRPLGLTFADDGGLVLTSANGTQEK
jgi:hypothetical protein